jgi:hypothetical protein
MNIPTNNRAELPRPIPLYFTLPMAMPTAPAGRDGRIAGYQRSASLRGSEIRSFASKAAFEIKSDWCDT